MRWLIATLNLMAVTFDPEGVGSQQLAKKNAAKARFRPVITLVALFHKQLN